MNTHRKPARRISPYRPAAGASRLLVPLIALLVIGSTQIILRHLQASSDAPTIAQRIYAMLVEWGAETSDFIAPATAEEINHRFADLRSPDSETRVRAAQWLASRGVRSAGDQIAAAMADSATLRPCQLAHCLGHLGDDRWVDELVAAASQTDNADLRACATMGLRSLGSDRALDALLELVRNGAAPATAIEALGVIGDAAGLPLLRDIARSDAGEFRRKAANLAIARIEIVNAPDPIPALLQCLDQSLRADRADEWALRWLAHHRDGRVAEHLAPILRDADMAPSDRERVAAALLALGDAGRQALAEIATSGSRGQLVAREALSLLVHAARNRIAPDATG